MLSFCLSVATLTVFAPTKRPSYGHKSRQNPARGRRRGALQFRALVLAALQFEQNTDEQKEAKETKGVREAEASPLRPERLRRPRDASARVRRDSKDTCWHRRLLTFVAGPAKEVRRGLLNSWLPWLPSVEAPFQYEARTPWKCHALAAKGLAALPLFAQVGRALAGLRHSRITLRWRQGIAALQPLSAWGAAWSGSWRDAILCVRGTMCM